MDDHAASPISCCGPPERCVFAKALLARAAACERSARQSEGEQMHVVCTSPTAHANCSLLAALLHERARFALRLPAAGHPMLHAQALRLHCGGLAALSEHLGAQDLDVHRNVALAQQRYGSLTELPWAELVSALAAWRAPRRAPGP